LLGSMLFLASCAGRMLLASKVVGAEPAMACRASTTSFSRALGAGAIGSYPVCYT